MPIPMPRFRVNYRMYTISLYVNSRVAKLEHCLSRFYATAAEDVPVRGAVARRGITLDRVEVVYGQVVELQPARAVHSLLVPQGGS